MTTRLTHIKVSNFRSISDEISVSLDAPIVLVHGANGSGKTSLLSAIELGLTGEVASLDRINSKNFNRLINREHEAASVRLETSYDGALKAGGLANIDAAGLRAKPLLGRGDANFYKERCYLSQSALSRLLEIYERDDGSGENPLSKFAQDLLGLDALDNLSNGLHHLGHVSRLRKAVPQYADNEAGLKQADRFVIQLNSELEQTRRKIEDLSKEIHQDLDVLGVEEVKDLNERVHKLPQEESDEKKASALSGLRREISTAISMLREASEKPSAESISDLEQKSVEASKRLDDWRDQHEEQLSLTFQQARIYRADLAGPESIGFLEVAKEAQIFLVKEAKRRAEKISADTVRRARIKAAESAREKNDERGRRLDTRISAISGDQSELAKLLSRLQEFIVDERCPVCCRDFSEVSDVSLKSHLSEHISKLIERSQDLQQMIADKRNALKASEEAFRQIHEESQYQLQPDELANLRSEIASIEEIIERLKACESHAALGDQLSNHSNTANQNLFENKNRLENLRQIRESSVRFVQELGFEIARDDGLESILNTCMESAKSISAHWTNRLSIRAGMSRRLGEISSLREIEASQIAQYEAAKQQSRLFDEAISSANAIRRAGNTISDRVELVRSEIVQQVFTETLNSIWKDLFVRLAPDEQFIPAFGVEQNTRKRAVATLQTLYRGKSKSGNPQTILSAGNLNTAALTLFLSLHLSVSQRLPWLVIDDPVQSMDEIHVAQFAALLRTLSRQHGRQIIIAVHERPLFDYLAMELSPASDQDRLVTIELSRAPGRETLADYQIKTWDPDSVLQFPKVV